MKTENIALCSWWAACIGFVVMVVLLAHPAVAAEPTSPVAPLGMCFM